jgi:hypothetical protein
MDRPASIYTHPSMLGTPAMILESALADPEGIRLAAAILDPENPRLVHTYPRTTMGDSLVINAPVSTTR